MRIKSKVLNESILPLQKKRIVDSFEVCYSRIETFRSAIKGKKCGMTRKKKNLRNHANNNESSMNCQSIQAQV